MTEFDWTNFPARIWIKSTSTEVYRHWATAEGLETWFPAKASFVSPAGITRSQDEFAQAGDRWDFEWFGGDAGTGTVEEAVLGQSFALTFAGLVSMEVTNDAGRILISLRHARIPDTESARIQVHLKCRLSWCFYLNNLKAVLEHGIDLREKDPLRLRDPLTNGVVNY